MVGGLCQAGALAGPEQTLSNSEDCFPANCLQMGDVHLGPRECGSPQASQGTSPWIMEAGQLSLIAGFTVGAFTVEFLPGAEGGKPWSMPLQPELPVFCSEFHVPAALRFRRLLPAQPLGASWDGLWALNQDPPLPSSRLVPPSHMAFGKGTSPWLVRESLWAAGELGHVGAEPHPLLRSPCLTCTSHKAKTP